MEEKENFPFVSALYYSLTSVTRMYTLLLLFEKALQLFQSGKEKIRRHVCFEPQLPYVPQVTKVLINDLCTSRIHHIEEVRCRSTRKSVLFFSVYFTILRFNNTIACMGAFSLPKRVPDTERSSVMCCLPCFNFKDQKSSGKSPMIGPGWRGELVVVQAKF